MSSADPPEPPPLPSELPSQQRPQRFNWRRPQFSVATLLGLLTLVAVVCALGMKLPVVFSYVLSITATGTSVAYVAFLVAGVWEATGRKRLFSGAALACYVFLTLSVEMNGSIWPALALQNYNSYSIAAIFANVIPVVQNITLSGLGGWVALRAARFWQPNEPESSS